MQAQNTLKDYNERKTYWRVLKNTRNLGHKEMDKMVGGVFEQRSFYDDDQVVCLWNKEKKDYWTFNLSYLQKVHGQEVNGKVEYLEKDGYAIGVGDTIVSNDNEYIVFDFSVEDGEVKIRIYKKLKEPFQNTNTLGLNQITKVIPLHSQTLPMTEEAMIEHITRLVKSLYFPGEVK